MPEPEDAFSFDAEQHIHEVTRAETLSGAIDRRKRLLCGNRAVAARHRRQAIVTVAAGRMISFAEIAQQNLAPARYRLAKADQRLDLLPLDPALPVACLTRLEQTKEGHHICDTIGHPGVRRQPVSSGATRLLVVGFEVFRGVEMSDEADIRLVDPHAEGDRRGDHDPFIPEKTFLM